MLWTCSNDYKPSVTQLQSIFFHVVHVKADYLSEVASYILNKMMNANVTEEELRPHPFSPKSKQNLNYLQKHDFL